MALFISVKRNISFLTPGEPKWHYLDKKDRCQQVQKAARVYKHTERKYFRGEMLRALRNSPNNTMLIGHRMLICTKGEGTMQYFVVDLTYVHY